MLRPLALTWCTLLVSSCGSATAPQHASVESAPPAAALATERLRVYFEAVLVTVPEHEVSAVGRQPLPVVAARTDGSVVSAPHVLLESGRVRHFALDEPREESSEREPSYAWTLRATVLGPRRVRIEVGLATLDGALVAQSTFEVDSGRTLVAPTTYASRSGKTLVILLRSEIVRTEQDLRAIYERKAQTGSSFQRGAGAVECRTSRLPVCAHVRSHGHGRARFSEAPQNHRL